MKETICFVINEFSNSSRAGSFIRESETAINTVFDSSSFFYIQHLSEMDEIIEQAVNSFDIIVACGGDGTIQSVAKQVFHAGKILGVIPLGSGNDFAKSIGIKCGKDIYYYLNILQRCKTSEIDFPSVNDMLFLNTVGIGFDGLTNSYAQKMKGITGGLRYTIAGIKAFFVAKPFSVSIQALDIGFSENIWMLVIANGSIEGGKFRVSPNSINTDGRVELVIFPAFNRIKLGLAFIQLSFGKELNSTYYKSISVQKAQLSFPSIPTAHSDGELIHIGTKVELTLLDRQIRAIVA